jgi:Flp pilus assembly protein TadD
MRSLVRAIAVALVMAVALPVGAQTAVEIKKELLPKKKKAEAEGKDLGQAGKEYEEGDKALRDGLQEEAVEHFKKAKELWPKD